MNNYRNYGNYGNRRYAGATDNCGCGKPEAKSETDCGCMGNNVSNIMSGMDCECKKKEEKPEVNCGCQGVRREEKKEVNCGCQSIKREEKCECEMETMYREVKKNSVCCEEDMPGKSLAMAYVPWQTWRKLYDVCEGFSTGTIFMELDLEFYGRRCN